MCKKNIVFVGDSRKNEQAAKNFGIDFMQVQKYK